MAATDQKYRSPKTMDVIFAVSCVGMLLSVFWMLYDDYAREWKPIQRTFRDVETALNERQMLEMLPESDTVKYRMDEVVKARKALADAHAKVAPEQVRLSVELAKADTAYRTVKADLDSRASYYNIAVDERSLAPKSEQEHLKKDVEYYKKEIDELTAKLAAAQAKLDAIHKETQDKVRSKVKDQEDALSNAEDELKKVTSAFDRFAKFTAQKRWKMGDSFRNLAILDAFAPATKINQIVLNDLTIEYGSFKDVARTDRCTSCHLGIERGVFDPHTLDALNKAPEHLGNKLAAARALLQEREKNGENLGFSISDLPTDVTTVNLDHGQVKMYAAHPRLDLFVDANSPHPMQKVGCTICHAGQGSATSFNLASHTPADARQEHQWSEEHSWQSNHFWDFPMLSSRFVESTCLKCHHEVTDLVRYGSKEEAPKLLRGYNLVRENGCFGCHEIAGLKSGRDIGPDLRLEPSPALDMLSPAEQEKAKSDPANPPGTYRKVGPSLRRIAEKTNQEWARKWLQNPRGFRPDTKMPHFYNLSNNNEPTLKKQDQDKFPATEIHAIAYYLFTESKGNLEGKDAYRLALENGLDWQLQLLDVEIKPLLTTEDKKAWDRLLPLLSPEEGGSLKAEDKEKLESLLKIVVAGAKQRSDMSNEDHRDLSALLLKVQADTDRQAQAKVELSDRNKFKTLLKDLLRYLEDHGQLTEKNKKELDAISRQLADLGLLSAPVHAGDINRLAARQKLLQDRLVELLKKQKSARARKDKLEKKEPHNEAEDAELETINADLSKLPADVAGLRKELIEVVKDLKKESRPTPISDKLVSWDGKTVLPKDLPPQDDKRLAEGRKLFTEHGCLACHTHEGTAKGGGVAVLSEANFGPNLSRVAAKLKPEFGDPNDHRRWLVQWLLNPNIHHPRTRMPITQLHVEEAVAIADWLLSQKVTDWDQADPDKPTTAELVKLARVYLAKAPGMTRVDLDKFLPEGKESWPGISFERLAPMPRDAEEHRLAEGQVNDNNLKWYIAKKSITRMGCYGCHDLPGFEQSKPIGVALNDWGKKDVERIAFEDAEAFVKDHFNIVDSRDDAKDKTKPDAAWKPDKDGKQPYEKLFFQGLEEGHRNRASFLHLKLAEPRSYDYNRLRAWDDRLRMPQFKFARSRPKKDESDTDYGIRQEREEAEAREAVMTFVLGLVADPIPAKYLAVPKGERLAEVKGRQLLDKFNCIGCHQARPGVYEFKPSDLVLDQLDQRLNAKAAEISKTHAFLDHNAWVGVPSPNPDRLMAFGTQPKANEEDDKFLDLRLADALRYTNRDRMQRDIPAGIQIPIPTGADKISYSDTYGGAFGTLLIPYLRGTYSTTVKGDDDARNLLPPPLIREGERVQPNWLYQFLLKPHLIRPQVVLRMPQFNMGPEDALALVNYFTAVEKLTNPNVGTAGSFLTLDQHDDAYWQRKNDSYVKTLSKDQLEKRRKELEPLLKLIVEDQKVALKPDLATAEDALKAAKDALAKAPNDKSAKESQESAEKDLKALKAKMEVPYWEEEWKNKDVYAADSYRLLLSHSTRICLSCHSAGTMGTKNAPALDRVYDRLRPDWTARWLSSPQRMYPYNPAMPVNFPLVKDPADKEDYYHGTSREQIQAVRDALLNFPRISTMPINRYYRPATAPAGEKK